MYFYRQDNGSPLDGFDDISSQQDDYFCTLPTQDDSFSLIPTVTWVNKIMGRTSSKPAIHSSLLELITIMDKYQWSQTETTRIIHFIHQHIASPDWLPANGQALLDTIKAFEVEDGCLMKKLITKVDGYEYVWWKVDMLDTVRKLVLKYEKQLRFGFELVIV